MVCMRMKTIMKILLTTTLTLFIVINPGWGEEKRADPRSFASFWIQFKTSVAKGDKEAIAGMTKFPFSYGDKQLSKTDLSKEYDSIFGRKAQRCFANAKPVKDVDRESFSVFCGSLIYVFEKVNGEYRFTDTGEND
jgi:hypothetical protein